MTSRTKDLGESYLQSEELSDEGEDTDTLLAEELRGMYRNRLKDMEEVDEKRDEAHRVGYLRLFGCALAIMRNPNKMETNLPNMESLQLKRISRYKFI